MLVRNIWVFWDPAFLFRALYRRIYYFAVGQPLIAIIYLGIDLIHALITTVLLLTGSFSSACSKKITPFLSPLPL